MAQSKNDAPGMCQRPAPRSGVVGTINKARSGRVPRRRVFAIEVSEPVRSVTDREQGSDQVT
jgi:hypothetical protein